MKRSGYYMIAGDVLGFMLSFVLSAVLFKDIVSARGVDVGLLSWDVVASYAFLVVVGVLYFLQKGHYKLAAPWWQQVKNVCLYSFFSL
jgi:hypothetical protein